MEPFERFECFSSEICQVLCLQHRKWHGDSVMVRCQRPCIALYSRRPRVGGVIGSVAEADHQVENGDTGEWPLSTSEIVRFTE